MFTIKTLRTKILLSLLIAAIPPYVILSAFNLKETKEETKNFLTEKYTNSLLQLENIIIHFLRASYINLQTVADNHIVYSKKTAPEERLSQIQSAEDHNLFLHNMSIIDTSGNVVVSTQKPYPIDWKHEPWFQRTTEGLPSLSPPIHIGSLNKKILFMLLPLIDKNNQITGVLCAELFVEHLFDFADNMNLSPTETAIITNADFVTLYHPDHKRFLTPISSDALLEFLKADSPTLATFIDSLGQKKVGIARHITFDDTPYLQNHSLYFAFFKDYDAAFAHFKTLQEKNLLIGLFGILLILIFSILLSRKIHAPLKNLVNASKSIAQGDLDVTVNIKTNDEFELLGKTFNRMIASIKKTTVSRDYFNNVTESLSDALIITNQNDRILFANQAATVMTGYKTKELFSKLLSMLFQKNAEKFLTAPKKNYPDTISYLETDLIKKDGKTLPVMIARSQIKNNPQGYVEMIYLIKDISQRKIMEEDLRRMNASLRENEKNLQEALAALKNTQEELIQTSKMSAVGQLAAGVAHEIKNPLAILQTSAELLKRLINDPSPKIEKTLNTLFNHIHRIDKIITELLGFSRKSREDDLEQIDVKELIEEAIRLGRNHDLHKKTKIILTPNPQDAFIIADKTLILQVVLNLIVNAIDAIENSGTITLSYNHAFVHCDNKKYAHIIIEDTGAGIPEDKIERIFEPFYTTKTVGEGTGLGLSTCYMIVEKYGGTITVKSQEGKGTTFTITLPAA